MRRVLNGSQVGPIASTRDTLFLDALYRDATGKAGITCVDVWDGFIDEASRFLQKGGEITRLLAARSAPIALPTEPATARRQCAADRHVRWRDRSFPWRPPLSVPINCSAVRGRDRCASSAGLGQRRAFVGTGRSRRRFCLAASRTRTRTGQG